MSVLPFAVAAACLIWFSFSGGHSVLTIIMAFVLPFAALIALTFLWKPLGFDKYQTPRTRLLNSLIGLACLFVFFSVPITNWPLRVAYKISRPSFDAVAQSLRSGKKFQQPLQVGVFAIQKAEIEKGNGKICLWTDLDPSGRSGFAMCPPDDVPFNLWSMTKLDENWQYIEED